MEARIFRAVVFAAVFVSLGASYRTDNFVVKAPTAELAQEIGQTAEECRKRLAVEWTGQELPRWTQPCPITAQVGAQLGAGGATTFVFDRGEVFGWQMSVQGSRERVLDSVLPHEITHTIFATHFRQPLPRWADEGACSTIEHPAERARLQKMLVEFLQTGRGIPFARMYAMKQYPDDVLPLYAQGHSLASFLIAQGGKQKFIKYVSDGLAGENWVAVTKANYGFTTLGSLQNTWLDWVRQGSPASVASAVAAAPVASPAVTLASNTRQQTAATPASYVSVYDRIAANRVNEAAGDLAPVPSRRRMPPRAASVSADAPQPAVATDNQPGPTTEWSARGGDHQTADANNGLVAPPPYQPAESDEASAYAAGASPLANQVTRPQPVERSRQIILEWSKQSPGPGSVDPAAQMTASREVNRAVRLDAPVDAGVLRR